MSGWHQEEEYQAGIRAERERIIKLLEDNNNCFGGVSSGNCTCTAIALIKGETE